MLNWFATLACCSCALLLASGAVQLALYRRDRSQLTHLSFSLFGLLAGLQAAALAVQLGTSNATAAGWAQQLYWALSCSTLLAWVPIHSTLDGWPSRQPRRAMYAVTTFCAAWFVASAALGTAGSSAGVAPIDTWAGSYLRVPLGRLGTTLAVVVLLGFALLAGRLLRRAFRERRLRALAVFQVVATAALAHDIAAAAGAFASPPLFSIAQVGLSFGGLLVLVSAVHDLRRRSEDLERVVGDRTAELRRTQTGLVQTEKLASVGLIAAGVAHEVNNPAAYVLTNLTLLRESNGVLRRHRDALVRTLNSLSTEAADRLALGERDLTELDRQSEEALNDAVDGIRRIRDIVADLKTLSRDGDGASGPVMLHRLVEASVSVAAPTVKQRASIDLQLSPTAAIDGHAGKLSQVIINLLINASESVEDRGRGRVTVRTHTRDQDVVLEVADNGRGIEPGHLGSIFEPLYTTKTGGAGLGLAICRRVVEEHKGRLEVESVQGEGTTMRILLPRRAQPVGEQLGLNDVIFEDAQSGTRIKHGTVLLLDDELLLVKVLARLLGRRHTVLKAYSVDEAVEMLDRGVDPDVILCDLMMPGKSGADFYRHLLDARPELARRVTFMSGGGVPEPLRTFVEGAGRPMLDKPVEPEVLLAHVASAMDERAVTPASGTALQEGFLAR